MANDKLIYASSARKAILKEDPKLAYCIDSIPGVDAIVLPCKIGATVYRIYDDCEFPGDCGTKMMCKGCDYRNLFIEKQAFCLSMLSQNGKLEKPYYLTHKEAKAALAKMDGGNEDG